ncbi:MAG: hypothetical protein HY898_12155 [Deltaproteobacteria bacterium]|nr:hypothetical protein [Deltaproteobacteria bacterium]
MAPLDPAPTACAEESAPVTTDTAPAQGVPASTAATAAAPSRRALVAAALLVLVALAPIVLLAAQGVSRRWMHDDAFINLRVVRNLLIGNGPIFNLGERVEVGTSPLWIALLALAGLLRFRLEYAAVYGALALTVVGMLAGQLAALLYNHDAHPVLHRFRTQRMLPFGVAIFASLPPAWDHATAGLETGLGLAWLGLTYLALVWLGRPVPQDQPPADQGRPRRHARPYLLVAALVGLGPLIRPDFALYAAAFFLPLSIASLQAFSPGEPVRSRLARLAKLVAAAGLIPGSYQIFRMGYFAAVSPNPALAKEAFRTNWEQGWCYARNFFGLYDLALPLTVMAIFALRAILRGRASGARLPSNAAASLLLAACLHVVYVVAIGGDYMHARLFLPAVFASTLVVSLVSLRGLGRSVLVGIGSAALLLPVLAWAGRCTLYVRVESKNQCDIGDERGWAVLGTGKPNPVALEDFKGFTFYEAGAKELRRVIGDRPSSSTDRRMVIGEETDGRLYPFRPFYRLKKEADSRLSGATTLAAIGIAGYLLPDNIHVVDRHGLGDPVGARIELLKRGRPGHEKRLPNAWIVARLAQPESPDDAMVAAARRALDCEPLRSLQRATTSPMTASLFADNLLRAARLHRLRVPADPFEAERRFCDNEQLRALTVGGTGGVPFRWHCPQGTALCSISGSFNEHESSISQVRPGCCPSGARQPEAAPAAPIAGPDIGDKGSLAYEQKCNRDEVAVGIHGNHSKFVRGFGLICAPLPGSPSTELRRVPSSGREEGPRFDLACPSGLVAVGIAGRAGALIDSLGVVCSK